MHIRCLILISVFLFYHSYSFPQYNGKYSVDVDRAKEIYNKKLYNDYKFLSGKEYKIYHSTLETSPMFDASYGMEGSVFSNGDEYSGMLAYDIFKDELIFVSELFKDCSFISLNPAVVDSFRLVPKSTAKSPLKMYRQKEYMFVRVNFPDNIDIPLKDGYYEISEIGGKKLIIRHESVQNNNEGEEAIIHGIFRYDYMQKKILYMDGNYYDINSKKKLLRLFPDKRKVLNKKINSYSINYNLISKKQLAEIIQLTNSI